MGRLASLRQTLGRMVAQPDCSCVLVDYSCPDRCGDWAEAHAPGARVVRMPGRTEFNLAAARNAGARHADAPWVCFLDADVLLEPGFAATLLRALSPGGYYRAASGDPGLAGTVACARADFARAGGYDEVYRGWSGEDTDLYDAMQFLGLEPRPLPPALLRHLPHPEGQRTRFYGTGHGSLDHAVNRVYRTLKWDAARLRRQPLTLDMRRALYERVHEVVTASFWSGRAGDLTVGLPPEVFPGGWSLSRTVAYRLAKDGGPRVGDQG